MNSNYCKTFSDRKLRANLPPSNDNIVINKTHNCTINDDLFITGIKSFVQYNICYDESEAYIDEQNLSHPQICKKHRIVTIVGENHRDDLIIPPDNNRIITISKYIESLLDEDVKYNVNDVFVFLELEPSKSLPQLADSFHNVRSYNIKETINMAINKKFENRFWPFDSRGLLFDTSDLYYSYHMQDIDLFIQKYVYDFDKNFKQIYKFIDIDIKSLKYSINNLKYLLDYQDDIVNNMNYIKSSGIIEYIYEVKKNMHGNNTFGNLFSAILSRTDKYRFHANQDLNQDYFISMLQKIYMKITDLFLLSYLLRKDIHTKNVIILVGDRHARNFLGSFQRSVIFEKLDDIRNQQIINIKNSYVYV